MVRWTSVTVLASIVASGLLSGSAGARSRPSHHPVVPAALVETSPSLAPFQHVRFCLRYPADCSSNPTDQERIDLTVENSELLDRTVRREIHPRLSLKCLVKQNVLSNSLNRCSLLQSDLDRSKH